MAKHFMISTDDVQRIAEQARAESAGNVVGGDSGAPVRVDQANQVSAAEPAAQPSPAQPRHASPSSAPRAEAPASAPRHASTDWFAAASSANAGVSPMTRMSERIEGYGATAPSTAGTGGYAEAAGIGVQERTSPADLPVMTKRRDAVDKIGMHEALADVGIETINARGAANGLAGAPFATQERLEQAKRDMAERDAGRQEEVAAQAQQDVNASVDEVRQQQLGPDTTTDAASQKPGGIFNREWGWTPRTRQARTSQPSMLRTSSSIIDRVKSRAKRAFGNAGRGYRVYGKMLGMPTLDFQEVAIGIDEMLAAVQENPDMVNRLFRPHMDGSVEIDDVSAWSTSQIIDFVRTHDIYVGTFKPPSNRGQDIQRRRLRVLENERRGIYIHPLMAAMYTADFDGDDMEVSFDPRVAEYAKDPMDMLVGIDRKLSLDMAFLPVVEFQDDPKGRDARTYVREVVFASFAQVDGRSIEPLVSAVLELGKTSKKKESAQEEAYTRAFREARRLADRMNPNDKAKSDRMMSGLCKAVYDSMHNLKVLNTLRIASETDTGIDVRVETSSDEGIYKVIDGMIDGSVPNNSQALRVMLNAYLGSVEGKNAPFRFSADVGKMLKMDSRLKVGDGSYEVDPKSDKDMSSLFESTVRFASSRIMAKEIKKQGVQEGFTLKLRNEVVREVGFFDDVMPDGSPRYASYADFLNRFAEAYNRHSSIINQANLVFLADMQISRSDNHGHVSPINPSGERHRLMVTDLAEPMLTVYGSQGVGRMFRALMQSDSASDDIDPLWRGNPEPPEWARRREKHTVEREYNRGSRLWITRKYSEYSLRAFAHENTLVRGNSKNSDLQMLADMAVSDLGDDDVMGQFWMLLAIADKRTGTASKYNESFYGIIDESAKKREHRLKSGRKTGMEMMSELLLRLRELDDSPSRTQMLWVNEIVGVLAESGADMFSYFGMDSAAGFLESKWARKMMEHAGDAEVLGGIRTAMVFEYRMAQISHLQAELPDPGNVDIDTYVDALNNLQLARDELSDASEVWHGIMREFAEADNEGRTSVGVSDGVVVEHESAFHTLARGARPSQPVAGTDATYEWDVELNAREFWQNPGDHDSLRSVIEDLDMDRKTKWAVIADVVGYWEQDAYLKSYEVGFQMEVGNDSSYTLSDTAQQGAMKVYNEFKGAFTRWGNRSQEALRDGISEAREKWGNERGRLMSTLQRINSSPWELVAIDDMMYADALMSVKDKTYAQTEKASQHPWTNAIYSALSRQRNGGFFNDVWRTDDRMLGVVSDKSVSIHDIIRILADPDAEMCVYNMYGEYCTFNRKALLEDSLGRPVNEADIEQDIWEYLEREPRVASALRMHNACVAADSDGSGYVGAKTSISETIAALGTGSANPIDHVKYLMRDHPVYAGIISLASPGRPGRDRLTKWIDSVSRNERRRVNAIENWLCHSMYEQARSHLSERDAAVQILAEMGITSDVLVETMRPNYDRFLDTLGLPPAVEGGDAEYKKDAEFMYGQCVYYLSGYIREIRDNVPLDDANVGSVAKPMRMGVDIVSMASFWDTIQELSGAKTNVSTGVEGAETYWFGMWASHISARDGYVNLASIDGDGFDESWSGMWTNLVYNGEPVLLEVGPDGSIANRFEVGDGSVVDIFAYAKSQNVREVVAKTPDGYVVRDGSTDSHGNPVPSLFAYMVSKRSNGAEAFNLKAKKSGIDGMDSITKMRTKYRMTTDENGNERPVSFYDIRKNLRDVAGRNGENGLLAAKAALAGMMLEENEGLGYRDLSLANYMSIADLMVKQGDDGEIYLRSLEMLYSAVKYRIGPLIDDYTDEEIRMVADAVVADGSETGVGIGEMLAAEAFDAVRPHGKAGSVTGIRPKSSMFERNYDLLYKLMEKNEDARPMSPARASILDEQFRARDGIREVLENCDLVRNYKVVGYAGATSGVSKDIKWTVGPQNMVVIGKGNIGNKEVADICRRAWELGMTVLVSAEHVWNVPKDMLYDAMPCSDYGDAIVPCFDMRLNGSEAKPYNGGRFAIHQVPYSEYTTSVEDPINYFELGDAMAAVTKAYTNRLHRTDSGSKQIKAEDLFPNVFRNRQFRHSLFTVSTVSYEEVALLVANEVNCTIDYGIVEGGKGFEQRKRDVDRAIEEYQRRFSETDPDGNMRGEGVECGPGSIVSWVMVEIQDQYTGDCQYVLAPVIPFPLHGPKKNVPERFSLEQVDFANDDNTLLNVNWVNTSDIQNSFVKYFDSSGGANKGMISLSNVIDKVLRLRDGSDVDVYIARQSTDSRKIGTDRRIKTMISLMAKARMHGYNFAMKSDGTPNEDSFPFDESDPGAHPENQGLRERMMTGRIQRSEWLGWLLDDNGGNRDMLFTNDARLNAFLNYECRKILMDGGNPYDYLANTYVTEDGQRCNTHVMWEFEAMFDQGINYEDSLLRYLHSMMPDFCPNGIEDKGDKYMFRLARENDSQDGDAEIANDFNRGVLQMQVPYPSEDGGTVYLWANVYIGLSFFGEEYSGFSRPNINGASNFLDAMNTMAYYGNTLDRRSDLLRAQWATADIGRPPRDGGAIGVVS